MPYWIFHFFFVRFRFVSLRSVSFGFVSFCLISFRFFSLHFASFGYISFRFVSFCLISFRSVSFRFYFVSHFTSTRSVHVNYLLFWMHFVANLLWLFRSFYLRRSSVEILEENDFFFFEFYFKSISIFHSVNN